MRQQVSVKSATLDNLKGPGIACWASIHTTMAHLDQRACITERGWEQVDVYRQPGQ